MEEDWYFEACFETYIPLLRMMEGLLSDGVPFRLTMSLTPTLLAMMRDELLQGRLRHHVAMLLELAEKEIHRTRAEPEIQALAHYYREHFRDCLAMLDRCGGDLSREFVKIRQTGCLELITCGATHGFLPLLIPHPEAVRAQVLVGAQYSAECLGEPVKGIWLPECGYYPGHERYLAEAGINFFFIEAVGVVTGDPRPLYQTLAPIKLPHFPVAAFGRDVPSSKQVWSAQEGYPGDYHYREFYRDVGFDCADEDYIRPYLGGDGSRKNLGLKYYRITGPSSEVSLGDKLPYNPQAAKQRAADHAADFLSKLSQTVNRGANLGIKPLIVAPYDAELFGHWWWEGVQWIDYLFRKMHFDQDVVKPITPTEYLLANHRIQVVQPVFSSWGYKGSAEFWLNDSNDYVYRHVHMAAERMIYLARRFEHPTPLQRRALNQCARELLLVQASDWPFILQTGTTVQYAKKRLSDHFARFTGLFEGLVHGYVDESLLGDAEWKDNIFPNIDYRIYR